MEEHGNKLGAVVFGGLDVLLQLVLDVKVLGQFVRADKGNFHAVDIAVVDAVIAECADAGAFQC